MHKSVTSNFVVPDFQKQCAALFCQISAETMVFPATAVNAIAERVASNSTILANPEIRRLAKMSVVAQKTLAKMPVSKISKSAQVTQGANILLTSILSELSIIADRVD